MMRRPIGRTVARTAVIAGTATAVSGRVARRQAREWTSRRQEAARRPPVQYVEAPPRAGRRRDPRPKPSSSSSSWPRSRTRASSPRRSSRPRRPRSSAAERRRPSRTDRRRPAPRARVAGRGPGCRPAQPVVRRRKRWAASGAKTTSMPRDQATAAATGCCMGQAESELDGFGLPNRVRTAAVTALTGFQSAMVCSQPGMPVVGHQGVRDDGQREDDDEARCLGPTPVPSRRCRGTRRPTRGRRRRAGRCRSRPGPRPALALVRQPIASPVRATMADAEGGREEVGDRPADQDRGPPDGKRPEAVDGAGREVRDQPHRRSHGRGGEVEQHQPGDGKVLVAAALDRHTRPQHVDEQQGEEDRLDGHIGELQRLAGDVHQVAAGEHDHVVHLGPPATPAPPPPTGLAGETVAVVMPTPPSPSARSSSGCPPLPWPRGR